MAGSVAKVDNANKTADLLTAPLNEVPKTTPLIFKFKDMIQKEKAKELYDKYFDLVEAQTAEQQEENARKAALIVVDEIIEALHEHHWQNRLIIDYFEEVKQEINKL